MNTSPHHHPPTLVPIIKVHQVYWPASAEELEYIRESVFIQEQGVPTNLEWDGLEQDAQHFLAFYNKLPVGTARLVQGNKLTRMAVLKEYRKLGIASALLKSVSRYVMHSGISELIADAQVDSLDFYLKHRFTVTGDSFYDAGILHKPICKKL